MSTGTGSRPSGQLMEYGEYVTKQLAQAKQRIRMLDFVTASVVVAVAATAYLLMFAMLDQIFVLSTMFRVATLAIFGLCTIGYIGFAIIRPATRQINELYVAHEVESASPGTKNSLMNWILLRNHRAEISPMIMRAIESRAASDLSKIPIQDAISTQHLLHASYVLASVVVLFCMYTFFTEKELTPTLQRILFPLSEIAPPTETKLVDILPGSTSISAGESVTISAIASGAKPATVRIYHQIAGSDYWDFEDLDPPAQEFGAWQLTNHDVQRSFEYYLTANDFKSQVFQVHVTPSPMVEEYKVTYNYPAYTNMAPAESNTGDIDAVEGTRARVDVTTNLPAKSGWLILKLGEKEEQVPMEVLAGASNKLFGEFTLTQDGTYQVNFADFEGKTPKMIPSRTITVQKDIAPKLQFMEPADPKATVPANSGVTFRLQGLDDYGLAEVSIRLQREGKRELLDDIKFVGEPEQPLGLSRVFVHEFVAEKYGLRPGDIVEYWAEALDNKRPTPNAEDTRHREPRVLVISEPIEQAKQQPQANPEEQPKDAPPKERQGKKSEPTDQKAEKQDKPQEDPNTDKENKSEQPGEQGQQGQQQEQPSDPGQKQDQQKLEELQKFLEEKQKAQKQEKPEDKQEQDKQDEQEKQQPNEQESEKEGSAGEKGDSSKQSGGETGKQSQSSGGKTGKKEESDSSTGTGSKESPDTDPNGEKPAGQKPEDEKGGVKEDKPKQEKQPEKEGKEEQPGQKEEPGQKPEEQPSDSAGKPNENSGKPGDDAAGQEKQQGKGAASDPSASDKQQAQQPGAEKKEGANQEGAKKEQQKQGPGDDAAQKEGMEDKPQPDGKDEKGQDPSAKPNEKQADENKKDAAEKPNGKSGASQKQSEEKGDEKKTVGDPDKSELPSDQKVSNPEKSKNPADGNSAAGKDAPKPDQAQKGAGGEKGDKDPEGKSSDNAPKPEGESEKQEKKDSQKQGDQDSAANKKGNQDGDSSQGDKAKKGQSSTGSPSDQKGDNSNSPGEKPGKGQSEKQEGKSEKGGKGDPSQEDPKGEKPGDKPGQQPGEKPGEKPGQQPGEQPGEKPGEPGEKPEGKEPGAGGEKPMPEEKEPTDKKAEEGKESAKEGEKGEENKGEKGDKGSGEKGEGEGEKPGDESGEGESKDAKKGGKVTDPKLGKGDPNGSGSGETSIVDNTGDEVNPSDKNKATDLNFALKNAAEGRQTDPELLKKMGMTQEEFKEFAQRVTQQPETQKPEVEDNASPIEAKDRQIAPDAKLRTSSVRRAGTSPQDEQRGMFRGSRVEPPPQYKKLFESYTKSIGQTQKSAKPTEQPAKGAKP